MPFAAVFLPCAFQTNMASSERASVRSIQSIAETAINHINQLVSLVEHRSPAATLENDSLNNQRPSAATGSLSQTSTSSNEQRSSGTSINALSELRRRFPTISRGRGASRDPVTGRFDRSYTSRPYTARRPAGRPLASEMVSKDVIVLEYGKEKIPSKSEKPELERSGRIISGFDIDRKWDAKKLHSELSSLLTGEMEGMYFEIVKNSLWWYFFATKSSSRKGHSFQPAA